MFDLDLGIDLGATTNRVYEPRRGVVVAHPAQHAVHVEQSVRRLIDDVHRGPLRRPRVVMTVPCHTPAAKRQALEAATRRAGAKSAVTIEAPVAAGIGAGVDVADATPSLVVDIGGRWTEVAVVALGTMQTSLSVPVGGTAIDEEITAALQAAHGLVISAGAAEELKRTLGSAGPVASETLAEVTGTDLRGVPASALVSSADVRRWIAKPVDAMVAAVVRVLDDLGERTAADLLLDGEMVLTGGGAQLRGLDRRMAETTGMAVRVARQSHLAAVVGAGACVGHVE